jgi:hypothetical protein
MPDAVDRVIWAPDDGWRYHPKHVEQFTDINKLHVVASCWTIFDIYSWCTDPWTKNTIFYTICKWVFDDNFINESLTICLLLKYCSKFKSGCKMHCTTYNLFSILFGDHKFSVSEKYANSKPKSAGLWLSHQCPSLNFKHRIRLELVSNY